MILFNIGSSSISEANKAALGCYFRTFHLDHQYVYNAIILIIHYHVKSKHFQHFGHWSGCLQDMLFKKLHQAFFKRSKHQIKHYLFILPISLASSRNCSISSSVKLVQALCNLSNYYNF